VCLLVAAFQVVADSPLIIAANRDERYDRDATYLTSLSSSSPRILGGRDELAGGTWLAVNEHGVVAGLTNKPAAAGRDPSRRSRGEIPLALAGQASAANAVERVAATLEPSTFNPCWVLVGDRESLYHVDMTDRGGVRTQALAPGVYVLENKPLGEPSDKVERVRRLIEDLGGCSGDEVLCHLRTVLADHVVACPPIDESEASRFSAQISACCVHTETYGTRSAMLVRDPASEVGEPEVWASNGPSCVNLLQQAFFV
jgi:uncharacterized protein with NRDE domain